MLQGTASDVGKSVVTTALCRIFKQDGYAVAPFKSQNMALNSYVTLDGKEIGRAQGVQAEACGIAATTDMNPVLIKPMHGMQAQIVVHGKPYMNLSAGDYRSRFLPEAKRTVVDALNRLREQYDIVVMEGAGSPAEINLKQNDIVNMNMAAWADAPVILVADIDRGGVFAFIVGTLELLEPHERERVRGFIINKFRGDISLLQSGLDWLEERTGIPVLGVLPYAEDLDIEAEDSVALEQWKGKGNVQPENDLDIVVLALPHISNFTDMDPLLAEPDVRVRYVRSPDQFGNPDAVIIPGTKSTMDDLQWLRDTKLADCVNKYVQPWIQSQSQSQSQPESQSQSQPESQAQSQRPSEPPAQPPARHNGWVIGICGGYQMLGQSLHDPHGVEGAAGKAMEGLALLPQTTVFAAEKRTERVAGCIQAAAALPASLHGLPMEGYEIHMGRTEFTSAGIPVTEANTNTASIFNEQANEHASEQQTPFRFEPLMTLTGNDEGSVSDGCVHAQGHIVGTYMHGLFHNDAFRRTWLNELRAAKGLLPLSDRINVSERQEQAFDRLADIARQHMDMEKLYHILHGQ
ncbi:cobyric acid synthase [Paenibacillus sp. 481]|uniref:cobyric acid synthase n=1 Tax=Paenibacillus sp. 481 TaxID=2835869 RepID=UPI003FA6A2AB